MTLPSSEYAIPILQIWCYILIIIPDSTGQISRPPNIGKNLVFEVKYFQVDGDLKGAKDADDKLSTSGQKQGILAVGKTENESLMDFLNAQIKEDSLDRVVTFGQLLYMPERETAANNEDYKELTLYEEACGCQAVIYLKGTEEQVVQAKKEWFEDI